MSTQIDERVVSMKFDNKDFEKNVAQTMDTLVKLDEQLDFKDAKANFKKLEDAANDVTLSGLTKSAEAVKVEFSAMSMVAISAINKIVDSTIDAGMKIVKNLSIDQVTAGFGKYEQKLTSVQAIMNSTGKSVEEVEAQMSKLMTYTDETSYSFTDMVANIGTFTSNRIPLDVAVSSMMGIANAAGFAGVNAEKATHAMQGFSKAMAKGFMDRQSWQWIQTAGMAIPELKEQFIEAAAAEGTLKKVNDGLYQTLKGNVVSVTDFETAMKDGWLTTNAMNKALNKFGAYSVEIMKIMEDEHIDARQAMKALDKVIAETGDETLAYSAKMFKAAQESRTFGDAIAATRDAVSTGWMKTFDLIFGNIDEAKELWSEVGEILYNIFAEPGNARNDMLEEWKELGGRNDILKAFRTVVKNTTAVVNSLRVAIDSVFPPMTAQRLKDMTKKFRDFVSYFKMSEPALYSLTVIVKTLLIPFRVIFELFKVGISVVAGLTKVVFALINAFLELAAIGNPITMLLEKIFGEERYARLAAAFNTLKTKISDMLKSISDRIKSSFGADSLFQVFLNIVDTITRILAPVANLLLDGIVWGFEQLAKMDFTSIQGFMSDMLRFFGSIGSGVITLFTTGFGNAAEALKEFKGFSLKSWFTGFKTDVKGITTEVTGLSKAFSEEGIVKNITNAASVVTGKLANIGGAVGELVGQISPAGIIVSGLGLTFIELSHNISLAIGSFAKVGTSLAGLMDSVKGVFSNIQTVIKTFNKTLEGKIQVEKFKALSLVIISFAGALTILSFVAKHNQNLLEVVGIVGLLLAEMAGFFAVMALINKLGAAGNGVAGSIKQFAVTLGVMAASLLLLASAITIMSKIDTAHIFHQMTALIAAMIGMVMSLKAIANSDKQVTEGAMVIIAFAFALRSIAKTLVTLSKANFENIPGTLVLLAGVIGAMYLLAKMAKNISWSGGAGMFAMVVSILALTGVLSLLAKVDVGALLIGMAKYVLLFGVMMTLAIAAKAATTKLGKNESIAKISGMFLSMAAAVAVLSLAVKTIGKMSLAEVVRGTAAVAAILAMFALITQVSKRGILDGQDAKQSFAGMAVAILALTLAIDYLGGLDTAKLVKGTAAVAAIMAMFALLELVEAKNKGATGSAIFIGATIAALTLSMAVLTLFPFDKIMTSAIALGIVLVAFGQAIEYMNRLVAKKNNVAAVIKMVVLIGGLTAALVILSGKDWKSMMAATVALSAVMLAFSALTQMIGKMEGNFAKTLKSLLQFSLIIAALMGITTGMVALLNLIDLNDNLVEKVLAFSIILASVSGVALILDKFSTDVGKTTKGIASVLIVMGALALISVAFWELTSSVEWSNITTNSGPIITSLAAAIVLMGICAALGVAIGSVGKMFDPASVAIGVANTLIVLAGILAVIAVLGVVMAALGKLEEKFGIAGALSTGGQMMIELFTNVGSAIGGFIGGIIGGVVGGIGAGVISTAGDALKEFVKSFSDIPEEDLNKTIGIVTAMAQFFGSLPDTSISAKSLIFGGNTNLTKVFEGMSIFTDGIKKMCEELGDGSFVDLEVIQKAVDAASIISDFENSLPKTGGLVQAWFGEGDLGKFSENMASFGNALWRYYVNTKSIVNWDLFEKGKTAGSFINELNKNLPESGALPWLTGQQDLGKFATNMSSLGEALYNFYDSAKDIQNWGVFYSGSVAGTAIANLAKAVAEVDYSLFSGNITLSDFGLHLNSLGSYMKQYNDNIADVNWSNFTTATDNLGSLVDTMSGANLINTTTISSFGSSMASLASSGFSAFIDAFTGPEATISIDDTAKTLVGTITSSLNSHSSNADFYGIGTRTINGMVNGINVNISSLKSAGTRAADSLCESIERSLEINSPSKRTHRIGKFAMMGLEKGLLENQYITNAAASNVANSVLQSMKNTLEIHSPSYRVRQEVAKPIIDAFPAEFDENNDAEKAAKAKAEAIVSAFKSGFEDSKEARELLDLERELFALKLDSSLTETERQAAMDEYDKTNQNRMLQTYVDDYKMGVQQYQTLLKTYGEESSYTKEAYKSMLQNEITLRNYASQLIEATTITNEDISNARAQSVANWKAFYEYTSGEEFTRTLQAALKEKLRTGEVGLLTSDPVAMEMSATERIQAELKAFDMAVRRGDWETMYADILKPIRQEEAQAIRDALIDPEVEAMKNATAGTFGNTVDDILSEMLGGFTIDEYAMQDVSAELTDATLKAIEDSLKETKKAASDAGATVAGSYVKGFETPDLGDPIKEALKNLGLDKDEEGGSLFEGGGIMAKLSEWTDGFNSWLTNLGGSAKEAVKSGSNVVMGIVEGITGKKEEEEVKKATKHVADNTMVSLNDAFEIHSPSKRSEESGMNLVLGLKNGLDKYGYLAVDSARNLGTQVLKALSGEGNAEGGFSPVGGFGLNLSPTITPILDLSQVEAGISEIDAMLSKLEARKVQLQMETEAIANQNGSTAPGTGGTQITYNQYNSSPKALDRLEIYRQTNNQLSSLKEGLNK